MLSEDDILAAAAAIQAKKAPDYAERAANIAEAKERLAAMEAEQKAIDDAAEAAKAKLSAPKAPDFQIPHRGYAEASVDTWSPRDVHDIFAVDEDETATARPNGGIDI